MSATESRLIILSGGAEVAALAVAEAAIDSQIPFSVISLRSESLLREVPACLSWHDLSSHIGNWSKLRSAFLSELEQLSGGGRCRLAVFPTEDGGLRLLNECRDDVLLYGEFPRARSLKMGGVDKAEVWDFACTSGHSSLLIPSLILDSPSQAPSAMEEFGSDSVFKPCLKPVDMDLTPFGAAGIKVVTRMTPNESESQVISRLNSAWRISERWLAQPRYESGPNIERSVCAARGQITNAIQVVEKQKYPRMGGTACWVSIDSAGDLVSDATKLLDVFDLIGICELAYLRSKDGHMGMIELNPRPWLQVGLIERAGFQIISDAFDSMLELPQRTASPTITQCNWMQPERFLAAAFTGDVKPREILSCLSTMVREPIVWAGYSSRIKGVRLRQIVRSLKILARRVS